MNNAPDPRHVATDDAIAELTGDGTSRAVDTNGDGTPDTILIDSNDNGLVDAVVVTDAEGHRLALADVDEDGEFDFVTDLETGATMTTQELAARDN
jgi:hypothetical protein